MALIDSLHKPLFLIQILIHTYTIFWWHPQFRRHCTSQSVAAAADLKPASRQSGGAIAFFRALFGCFVLNFSSHFLLLTPPGKKTTTGDTTSSLKNYVQNKSYQCFQICSLCFFLNEKSSVVFESVFWYIWQKSKSVQPKKLVKLQQLLFVLLDCLCVK